MEKNSDIDLTVYYFSGETLSKYKDKQLGKIISWDTDLVGGYSYKVLNNNSPTPSIYNGFFGLINLDIASEIKINKYDYVISHGWRYMSNWLVFLAAFRQKIPVILRGEMPLKQEFLKPTYKLRIKKIILSFLFKRVHAFLSIGSQNKDFYMHYGAQSEKIYFAPYAIDNDYFRNNYKKIAPNKANIKKDKGFGEFDKVLLFVGKFIDKKRPMDLLEAFCKIKSQNCCLVFVGDGKERKKMERYIADGKVKNVFIEGFKNQSELGEYYTVADLFILPSGLGETWGLVLNEAMNYDLPIGVSSTVGSSDDLVQNNGFVFKEGDVEDLSKNIEKILGQEGIESMGKNSYSIVKKYSFENIEAALTEIVNKCD